MRRFLCSLAFYLGLCSLAGADVSQSKRVDLAAGYRAFSNDASAVEGSYNDSPYVKFEAEYDISSNGISLDTKIFYNWDKNDVSRRYYDVREALIAFHKGSWRFEAGRGLIFWGVSETINVVNTLNQVDLSESVDGKTKTGQNMATASYAFSENTFTAYYLGDFEEIVYPDRPSPTIPISDVSRYETEQNQHEYALRWHGLFDFGEAAFSYFKGIRRDPLLVPAKSSSPLLEAYYIDTEYVSLEGLAFLGSAIVKFEGKLGEELDNTFSSYNIGFEYPTYPSFAMAQSIAWVFEYVHDSRKELAETMAQNDFFAGGRFSLGDFAQYDSRIILGYDLDHNSKYLDFSITHRITDFIRWEAKLVQFIDVGEFDDRLFFVQDEDFGQVELHISF